MKNPRPIGIIVISIFMFLLPFLVFALANWAAATNGGEMISPTQFLAKNWPWLVVNGLLSCGILKLNKIAWFGAIGLSGWNLIKGPVELAFGSGLAFPYLKGQNEMLLSAWVTVLLVSLPYAIVVGYLCRSDVKKLFISKDA